MFREGDKAKGGSKGTGEDVPSYLQVRRKIRRNDEDVIIDLDIGGHRRLWEVNTNPTVLVDLNFKVC